MEHWEYLDVEVDWAAGTWRDSAGRRGTLPHPHRGAPVLGPLPVAERWRQLEEVLAPVRKAGWREALVVPRDETGVVFPLGGASRVRFTFRRPAARNAS